MSVRALEVGDLDDVVERVSRRLLLEARHHNLINPSFSHDEFKFALAASTHQSWVAVDHGRVSGHLYGATLVSPHEGRCAWTGPDGVSFDRNDSLVELLAHAHAHWVRTNVVAHYVWVLDCVDDTALWYERGFARQSVRGVLPLRRARSSELASGLRIRRGGADDLTLAIELDHIVELAQRSGSRNGDAPSGSSSEELEDLLRDDDVHYYVAEYEGRPIGHAFTYLVERQRGSFEATLHLSDVAVQREHQHRGVGQGLVNRALNDAYKAGFRYAETNWYATNHRAAHFWLRYGFRPTYVRLRRQLNDT